MERSDTEGEARTARIGRRGYTDQTSTLWSEEGRLLVTAEQLMWFNIPA